MFTSGLLHYLSRDKLWAVYELREVGVGVVRHVQPRQRPLLRLHLPTDLHVDHFHFLTVFQSLTGETKGQLVCVVTEIQHLKKKNLARTSKKVQKCAYFQDEVDVGGEGLHSVEAGDESDGQEAFLIHLPPQEEVTLQVVQAEVVLTTGGRAAGKTHGQCHPLYTDKSAFVVSLRLFPSMKTDQT